MVIVVASTPYTELPKVFTGIKEGRLKPEYTV
jgi:hypothetical protein